MIDHGEESDRPEQRGFGKEKAKPHAANAKGREVTRSFVLAAVRSSSDDQFKASDAFIKLLQSPLVAELVAVAATAALGPLAENGFTSGKRDPRQAGRQGGQGGRQSRRRGGRPPARAPRSTKSEKPPERLRAAQKRKLRAADGSRSRRFLADSGSTSSPRVVSMLIQAPGASQPARITASIVAKPENLARKGGRRRPGRTVAREEARARSWSTAGRAAPSLSALRRIAAIAAASLFDEHRFRRASRQRLEAERAAAREQVGDAQILEAADPARQHRE